MKKKEAVPTYELLISRREFSNALKTLSRSKAKSTIEASLQVEDGCLCIEVGETSAALPARGDWPEKIFVEANWVRRLAKRLPAGDPIRLRVEDERVYVNRYSEPCSTASSHPAADIAADIDEQPLILEAAQILKPLRLTRADLAAAVAAARARGPASWRAEDRKMTAQIAKAWILLAPLGVETADLRRLVDQTVRDAWKQPKE
jgi:hypothetical protein